MLLCWKQCWTIWASSTWNGGRLLVLGLSSKDTPKRQLCPAVPFRAWLSLLGAGWKSSNRLHADTCREAHRLIISLLYLQLMLGCKQSETYPWVGSAKEPGTGLTLTMEKVASEEAGFDQSSELLQVPLWILLFQIPFLIISVDCPWIYLASFRRWITHHVASLEQHVPLWVKTAELSSVSLSTTETTSVMFSLDK